jgi:hypothetical protein
MHESFCGSLKRRIYQRPKLRGKFQFKIYAFLLVIFPFFELDWRPQEFLENLIFIPFSRPQRTT